jgi:hypothetical protein
LEDERGPPPVRGWGRGGVGVALGNVGSGKDAGAGGMLPGRGAARTVRSVWQVALPADTTAPRDPLLAGGPVPCASRVIRKKIGFGSPAHLAPRLLLGLGAGLAGWLVVQVSV